MKRMKTTQKQPKQPPKIIKRPKTTQIVNVGEIWNFLLAFVFQVLSRNAKFGYFERKSINFVILTKLFYIYPNLTVVILINAFEQSFPNEGIMGPNQSAHLEEMF